VDQGIAITASLVGDDISCMMAIKLSEFFFICDIHYHTAGSNPRIPFGQIPGAFCS
jgi:hypothetical protein